MLHAGWWSHEISRIHKKEWSDINKCHFDTFGFYVKGQFPTTSKYVTDQDIITENVNLQSLPECEKVIILPVSLKHENFPDTGERKMCLIHRETSFKLFHFMFSKIITRISVGDSVVKQADTQLVGNVVNDCPDPLITCWHRGQVFFF